jgi:hypothetical protein
MRSTPSPESAVRHLPLSAIVLLLCACPTEEPEPEIPIVEGQYVLTAQQRDSDCMPEVASADQILGFMEETLTGVPVLSLEIVQDGEQLDGLLDPSGCEWSGLIDTLGDITLSGPCHEADVARIGRIAANISPFGEDWELTGTLSIEVDTQSQAGDPGPDGITDCEVLMDLSGTGQ